MNIRHINLYLLNILLLMHVAPVIVACILVVGQREPIWGIAIASSFTYTYAHILKALFNL